MAKQIVTCSGNMQAGEARIGQIVTSKAYMASAEGLLHGVLALSGIEKDVAPSRAFLAAQVLECALKAYLSNSGVSEADLKKKCRRHNLEVLWQEAVSKGLGVPVSPPDWCVTLNQLHDTPYHLRYPVRVHGLVLPRAEPLTSELKSVVETVSNNVRLLDTGKN
ncbi:hypothetical protein KG088_18895 [Halomonas sp. TRM85114]|uniref:hypothetical protein n=1 Tax=Halomonas jincaotanensis TaxID=2810616 RepID=UPI001BD3AD31|nr:hypothetical protein [Halomonas jincaotanensis]MBS9405657.1 hypothetical protein [Halomonas jincaotanensis]